MNIKRKFSLFAMSALLFSLGSTSTADPEQVEKLVSSINSVAAAKNALKVAIQEMDSCYSGSCFNETSLYFCEIVGALDLKVNGQIINDMSGEKADIFISSDDLAKMKLIFQQCKPTNYQYWNYDQILHVGYRPSESADKEIRKYLGVSTVEINSSFE